MTKRLRKFPHLDDYLTAGGVSVYLNINPKDWKQREYKGTLPPAIILDNTYWYKWSDILDWIKKNSYKSIKGPKRSMFIAERNHKIIERYNFLPKKKPLLRAAKLIAEENKMKPMSVYTVLWNHKNKRKNEIKKLNEINFQSVVKEESKVIKVDFPKIVTPLERSIVNEDTTKNHINDKLPNKSGLFDKIYNMIIISDKHKNC